MRPSLILVTMRSPQLGEGSVGWRKQKIMLSKLNPKDIKLLLALIMIFNSPPILVRIPIMGILMFIPLLFWISIPGIPMGLIGVPFYEIKEFGAIPKGFIGWALIVLFWSLLAFVTYSIIRKVKSR